MAFLTTFLPIIIYILLIILLIVGIIIGIKLIATLAKVNKVVDDVNNKVKTLDGFFSVIDFTTDKIAALSDWIVDGIHSLIIKVFKKRKRKKVEEELENIEEEIESEE